MRVRQPSVEWKQRNLHRECQEETGLVPQVLVPLFDLMPSAGSSDEHMFFFLGVVDASKVLERAGAADEQEDTRPMRVPIDRALEAPPYNLIIHSAPFSEDTSAFFHWHVELMPRIVRQAGFEWGSGFYINPVLPEQAGAFLRETEVDFA